jgi:hypothetical protein
MTPLQTTWHKATADAFELSFEGGSVLLLATHLRPDPSEPSHMGDLELRAGPEGERGFVALVASCVGLELGPPLPRPGPLTGVRGNIVVNNYQPRAPFDAKLTLEPPDEDGCAEIYFNLDERGAVFATKDEAYDPRVIELFATGLRDGRAGALVTRALQPAASSLDEIFSLACRGTDDAFQHAMAALERSGPQLADEVPALVQRLATLWRSKPSFGRRDALAAGRGILNGLAHRAAADEYAHGLSDRDESLRRDALISLDLQSLPTRKCPSFLEQPGAIPPLIEALDRFIGRHALTESPSELKRAIEIRARLVKR